MNKKVIIIGGEGNGGVIAACIEDNRRRFGDPEWEVAGFVNDYETQVCGYPVLGRTDDVGKLLENPEYLSLIHIFLLRGASRAALPEAAACPEQAGARDFGNRTGPVSYTQLDVYKRQAMFCSS